MVLFFSFLDLGIFVPQQSVLYFICWYVCWGFFWMDIEREGVSAVWRQILLLQDLFIQTNMVADIAFATEIIFFKGHNFLL